MYAHSKISSYDTTNIKTNPRQTKAIDLESVVMAAIAVATRLLYIAQGRAVIAIELQFRWAPAHKIV